jgi:hypothetical protein
MKLSHPVVPAIPQQDAAGGRRKEIPPHRGFIKGGAEFSKWFVVFEESNMRKFKRSTWLAIVLAMAFGHVAADSSWAVPIPDKNLEAALRANVFDKKNKPDELTEADLGNIFVLDGSGKGIANLSGLEHCKNLASLKLSKNEIVDLAPLKGLTNLQSLDLASNKIADAAPLAGLTKLQYLELSHNQIANVGPLSGLSALSALYLTDNQIADVAPLGGLAKLSSLYLGKNKLTAIQPLAGVTKLSTLELKENEISDIAPLAKQTELRYLFLEKNKIADLAPLVEAAKADAEGPKRFAPFLNLFLAENPLSDAAKSAQLPALQGFGVRVKS